MRRYSQTTPYGGTTTYLHDQKNVAQSTTTNAQPNPINDYMTIPGTGEVLAFTTAGSAYVPLHDRLGSTIGLVNSSNSLQTQYAYEPFGNVTTTGQASGYPYLFAGMELDSSGLYHTQTRYYSPTFGRFLTTDAGLPVNAFTYADDDPVNATDPTGMSPEYVSGAAGMSPPPDDAIGASDAHNETGGLGGTMLAQSEGGGGESGCPSGVCGIDLGSWINNNNGGFWGGIFRLLRQSVRWRREWPTYFHSTRLSPPRPLPRHVFYYGLRTGNRGIYARPEAVYSV